MAIAVAALTLLMAAPNATAAAGVWGTGNWPYSNGIVCTEPGGSVPLVAWQLASTSEPGFVLNGFSESNGVDSSRPATDAQATDAALIPYEYGGLSSAQLAAIAYLIAESGSDPSPARVAEVSEVIAEQSGAATGVQCIAEGTGGTSTADAQQLWVDAEQRAGPYHVTLSSTSSTLELNTPIPVTATVTSVLGYPVPGIDVHFASTGVGSPSDATTDANGSASGAVTVTGTGPASGAAAPQLTATVSVPTTLRVRTESGASPTVYAAAPTPFIASLAIPFGAPKILAVKTAPNVSLARVGLPISTTVTASGLNGHPATATVAVAGPLPLPVGADGCADLTASDWTAALAASTDGHLIAAQSTASFVGDGSAPGPTFTPTMPGCYATSAQLATTDLTPNPTAAANYAAAGSVVAVVAISVTAQSSPGGVAQAERITPTVTVDGTPASSGSVTGAVRGPLPAMGGACAEATWNTAATAGAIGPTALSGPGTTALTAPGRLTPGCYALDLHITVTVGQLGSLAFPLPAGSAGTTVLVLAPAVVVNSTSTWIDTDNPQRATVTVLGTYNRPGQLTDTLIWQGSTPLGCAAADWRTAAGLGSGATVPTSGDGVYLLASVPAQRPGCYSLIVTLTLDGNSSVTVTNGPGAPGSIVAAQLAPLSGDGDARPALANQTLRTEIAVDGFAVLLIAGTVGAGLVAARSR